MVFPSGLGSQSRSCRVRQCNLVSTTRHLHGQELKPREGRALNVPWASLAVACFRVLPTLYASRLVMEWQLDEIKIGKSRCFAKALACSRQPRKCRTERFPSFDVVLSISADIAGCSGIASFSSANRRLSRIRGRSAFGMDCSSRRSLAYMLASAKCPVQ